MGRGIQDAHEMLTMEPLRLNRQKRSNKCLKLEFAYSKNTLIAVAAREHSVSDVEKSKYLFDIELSPFIWVKVLQVVGQCPGPYDEVIQIFARQAEDVQVLFICFALEEQVIEKVLPRRHFGHRLPQAAFNWVLCGSNRST